MTEEYPVRALQYVPFHSQYETIDTCIRESQNVRPHKKYTPKPTHKDKYAQYGQPQAGQARPSTSFSGSSALGSTLMSQMSISLELPLGDTAATSVHTTSPSLSLRSRYSDPNGASPPIMFLSQVDSPGDKTRAFSQSPSLVPSSGWTARQSIWKSTPSSSQDTFSLGGSVW